MRERVRMHPKVYEVAKSGDLHSLMTIISEDGEDLSHQTTPMGNNILHVAAQYQQVDLIKDLLRHPSGPILLWQGNCKGDTPLHVAAKVGSHEVVRVFADLVIQPDACKELLRKQNSRADTALHYAIRGGHVGVVKLLIQEDPQLCQITNAADESPLYLAADRRLSKIFELILNASSSSSAHKGPKGLTALHAAVVYSLPSWGNILEKRPEVIRERDAIGWTPLHYVACLGNVKAVRLLLRRDTSVAYVADKEGQSALHIAAFRGHVNVIDEFLRSCPGAGDIMNDKGQTALHAAVIGGQANVVEHILGTPDLEDLINEQDADGNTALHLAALHKQYNTIYKLARDKRVDRLATNKDHLTAIEIFDAHKEVGYRAAKVKHVLNNSCGISGIQGWVIEYVKKRLDKQHAEGQCAVSITTENIQGWVINYVKNRLDKQHAEGQRAVSTTTESSTADQENLDSSKRRIDLQLIVAVLIATVTFAATFTMPGGYNNDGPDRGMVTLAGKAAFQAFVIFNTSAFGLSILAIFLQFDTSKLGHRQQARYTSTAARFIFFAIVGMGLAFACGTYVVLTRTIGIGIIPYVACGFLAIVYSIGTYLDPEATLLGLPGTSGRDVRSLLFDYDIL